VTPLGSLPSVKTQGKVEISRREGATFRVLLGLVKWKCGGVGGTHSKGDVGG
jgi:hypothetical protein